MLWAGTMLKQSFNFLLMSCLRFTWSFRHTDPRLGRNGEMPDADRMGGRESGVLMSATWALSPGTPLRSLQCSAGRCRKVRETPPLLHPSAQDQELTASGLTLVNADVCSGMEIRSHPRRPCFFVGRWGAGKLWVPRKVSNLRAPVEGCSLKQVIPLKATQLCQKKNIFS